MIHRGCGGRIIEVELRNPGPHQRPWPALVCTKCKKTISTKRPPIATSRSIKTALGQDYRQRPEPGQDEEDDRV